MNTIPTIVRKFTPGTLVQATSFCDSNCVWTFEVVKRTAKFVTLVDVDTGDQTRTKIREGTDGSDWTMPFGSYSMAPVVRAA